jgi:hypothetical protein
MSRRYEDHCVGEVRVLMQTNSLQRCRNFLRGYCYPRCPGEAAAPLDGNRITRLRSELRAERGFADAR